MSKQPRRFTKQMQQEDISRCQFKERLVKFGWQTIEPQRDLGEDMQVQIYFDGRATGVTFHTQLKSVTDLEKRKKKRSNFLPYPFKVKDLIHWARFDLPLVLVVWDVELREGRWILKDDFIAQLDENKPSWSQQKEAFVDFPWEDNTSDSGLEKLRMRIGDCFYPLISKDKNLSVKLRARVPNTNEGMRIREKIQRHVQQGDPLILEEDDIGGVVFSKWWSKWSLPTGARFVRVELTPKGDKEIIASKIEFLGKNGKSVTFEHVVFRAIKSGTELLVLSNQHQASPIHFQIESRKVEDDWIEVFQPQFKFLGHSVTDAKKIVEFCEIASFGRKILVEFQNSEYEISTKEFNDCSPQSIPISPYFIEFVTKLYEIQNRTGCLINIPLEVSDWAQLFTNQLFEIISKGVTSSYFEAIEKCKIDPNKCLVEYHDEDGSIEIIELIDNSTAQIFETEIHLGKRKDTIRGRSTLTQEEFISKMSKAKEGSSIEIELFEVTIIKEFDDWIQK